MSVIQYLQLSPGATYSSYNYCSLVLQDCCTAALHKIRIPWNLVCRVKSLKADLCSRLLTPNLTRVPRTLCEHQERQQNNPVAQDPTNLLQRPAFSFYLTSTMLPLRRCCSCWAWQGVSAQHCVLQRRRSPKDQQSNFLSSSHWAA